MDRSCRPNVSRATSSAAALRFGVALLVQCLHCKATHTKYCYNTLLQSDPYQPSLKFLFRSSRKPIRSNIFKMIAVERSHIQAGEISKEHICILLCKLWADDTNYQTCHLFMLVMQGLLVKCFK